MKKHAIILAVFLLGTAGTAIAQTGKFEIGAQAGPSIVSLRGNDVLEKTNTAGIGFTAGLFVQYNLNETFSLRVDPGFERKGSTTRATVFDEVGNEVAEISLRQNLDYISVPLLLRAGFGKKYKVFANVGPYVSFLAGTSQVEGRNNLPAGFYQPDPVFLKDVDFGLTGGVGFLAPLSEKLSLSVELRDNLGLKNISSTPVVNAGKIQTNALNLLVGIGYRL